MAKITVTHLGADAFEIHTRSHSFYTDQPSPGRVEIGPTPTELFVAALAACAGFYAEHFLRRHGLAHHGLRVDCAWALRVGEPSRVTRVSLTVTPPGSLPQEWHADLISAVKECTVHNSLLRPPDIAIELATAGDPVPASMKTGEE